MSKKLDVLQEALNHTVAPAKITAPIIREKTRATPSREGKDHIGAWLHSDFKKSIRLVQVQRTDKVYIDDLIAEALNDLFRKYDVPIVSHM